MMTDINKRLFRKGVKDGIPIGLGYFAVSFTLGIAAKNAGNQKQNGRGSKQA